MLVARINDCDTANGPGIGISVWFQGCSLRCKGCHNQQLWPFEGINISPMELVDQITRTVKVNKGMYDYIAILGGEPLDQDTTQLWILLEHLAETNLPVILWTGYTLKDVPNSLLYDRKVDYIITGAYIERKRNPNYFSGSSNQRIYRVKWDGTCVDCTQKARTCNSWAGFFEVVHAVDCGTVLESD